MIKLFTSKNCAYCPMVKNYLKMNNVDYKEVPIDIFGTEEVVRLTGQMRVPALVTPKGISIGWNPSKIISITR